MWARCKEKAKQLGKQTFANMTLGMLVDTQRPWAEFPRLKGRAAEIKALTPVLADVWPTVADMSVTEYRIVGLALRYSAEMDDVLDRCADMWALGPEEHEQFQKAAFHFLACQTSLANAYNAQGLRLFNTTVKSHYLCHLSMSAGVWNPRQSWNFLGEDWVHQMRRIAQSAIRGVKAWTLPAKLISKYRPALHIRLQPLGS